MVGSDQSLNPTCVHGISMFATCMWCNRFSVTVMPFASSEGIPPPVAPEPITTAKTDSDGALVTIEKLRKLLKEAIARSRTWKRRYFSLKKMHDPTVRNLREARALLRDVPPRPIPEITFPVGTSACGCTDEECGCCGREEWAISEGQS